MAEQPDDLTDEERAEWIWWDLIEARYLYETRKLSEWPTAANTSPVEIVRKSDEKHT